jgi:hypothetical protein
MKAENQIPYYAPDGSPLGFRSLAAAKRLVDGGFVTPSYGRKGHLKAIWLRKADGASPVETNIAPATQYSFQQRLDSGNRCWRLRRLDQRDEEGTLVTTRGVFLQVVSDCLVA